MKANKKRKRIVSTIFLATSASIGAIVCGLAGLLPAFGGYYIVFAILGFMIGGIIQILPNLAEHFFSQKRTLSSTTVLILEDDLRWLNQHKSRLEKYGLTCYATQYADKAIEEVKNNSSIRFGLIDEILYVPSLKPKERQDTQGKGVVDIISNKNPEIKFIFVTDSPMQKAGILKTNVKEYRKERKRYEEMPSVLRVIDKEDIEDDTDKSYKEIIDLIKRELKLNDN